MVAPFGITRKPNLPYDSQQSLRTPAGAKLANSGEIQEIRLSSTQGDRIELAPKNRPHFGGNAGQPGDTGQASGSGSTPEPQGSGDSGGDDLPPPGLVETAKYFDTKVQALAKEKNITLQELPEGNANQYKTYLFLASTPHSVLASISSIEPSKLLEMVDKHPETPNLIQQLLSTRLGLQLDANVETLANKKNIILPVLSPEEGMVYQNALKKSVEALYQDNHEGSGTNDQGKAEEAILSELLAVRQNPAAASDDSVTQTGSIGQAGGAGHDHPNKATNSATGGQASSAPQGTPPDGGDDIPPATGEQTVPGATDPKAVDNKTSTEAAKPADDKKETNADKKEEQNWKSGYIGWKAGIGAALLAGGIALKMTLIGIIPGLIMAGVGAALLGWSGINWLSKDK